MQHVRWLGFEQPARPLAGPYYAVLYEVIGDRGFLQSLLLGAVNGLATLALWRFARSAFGPRTGVVAAVVFAVIPNHGAGRFWIVIGNYSLAVALVLFAAAWLFEDRQTRARTAALFVVGILLYEAVFGLIIGLVVLWVLGARFQPSSPDPQVLSARIRTGFTLVIPTVATAGLMFVMSPKDSAEGFVSRKTIGSGLLGEGVSGIAFLEVFTLIALSGAMLWAAVSLLPSYRDDSRTTDHVLRGGAPLFIAAMLPLAYAGTPFAVAGIFDRNNLVPTIGLCILIAGLLDVVRKKSEPVARFGFAALLVLFTWQTVVDMGSYTRAVRHGDDLIEQITVDVDIDAADVVLVVPHANREVGVDAFIYPGDIGFAMAMAYGDQWGSVSLPWDNENCIERAETATANGDTVVVYDQLARLVTPYRGAQSC